MHTHTIRKIRRPQSVIKYAIHFLEVDKLKILDMDILGKIYLTSDLLSSLTNVAATLHIPAFLDAELYHSLLMLEKSFIVVFFQLLETQYVFYTNAPPNQGACLLTLLYIAKF